MIAGGAGRHRMKPGKRMIRRRDGDQFDRTGVDSLQLVGVFDNGCERPADADASATAEHQGGDCAQRLYMQPQRDGREFPLKRLQNIAEPCSGKHDVDRDAKLRLKPFEQPLGLGPKAVDAVGDGPYFGQHRLAGYRQGRPAGRFAVEQRQAQLGLEIVDAIGDDRSCPVKAAAGGGEAACLRHCQENAQLVEGRSSWLGHRINYSTFSNNMINIIPVFFEAPQAYILPQQEEPRMTVLTATAPKLTQSEWKQVASTLLGVDLRGAGEPARPVRQFMSMTRRNRKPADQYREALSELGYNDRQIAALGLLSL